VKPKKTATETFIFFCETHGENNLIKISCVGMASARVKKSQMSKSKIETMLMVFSTSEESSLFNMHHQIRWWTHNSRFKS